MALALARKYRPKRFADLLVQDHVAVVLRGAVVKHRVGHGYLLTGPRGVGKTTAARILAMALNCERPASAVGDGEPCGECESCQRIWSGAANLDVVEIDAASNRGVDDARDLRERAMYAASREGRHKVYIVDEAHMLTREAWNALLKILEEPPPGVVFVFATTEPQKIAQTAAPVLSRLQRFDFRRIGSAQIRERLRAVLAAEGIEADDDALTLIARQADGGMRDALSVLDQCLSFGEGRVTAARVREVLGLVADEIYGELLGLIVAQEPRRVFVLLDQVEAGGADLVEFLAGAGEVLRALLMLELGAEPEGLTEALRHILAAYRGRLGPGDLVRMLKLLAEAEPTIRRSGTPRLAVETLLLRWALLDRTVLLEEVLAAGAAARGPAPDVTGRPERAPDLPRDRQPVPVSADEGRVPPVEAKAIPFTLEGVAAAWSEVVALGREQSRFLADALAEARVVSVAPPEVVLEPGSNPIHQETLDRQRDVVEGILTRLLGVPARVSVGRGEAALEGPRVRRLSEAEARAERLKVLRGRDPALEAAAEMLDLEVLE
ncbi:MAG TPA: DNA polymerase III subunit gamma/tau [Gemmatimonadales bacterium]|jgi:DNA polymerase-3 subunit gamma/tau|nr:DNA polymerase III subunit gamma/tau [Gemmatimonadales bacterium]